MNYHRDHAAPPCDAPRSEQLGLPFLAAVWDRLLALRAWSTRAWRSALDARAHLHLGRISIVLIYALLAVAYVMTIRALLGPRGFSAIPKALSSLNPGSIALSAACVCVVFTLMWTLEQLALRDAGAPPRRSPMVVRPLIANALSLASGFGLFSGTALRVRLYGKQVDAPVAIFVASGVLLMSILGGALLAGLGLVFVGAALEPIFPIDVRWLPLLGYAILAGLVALLVFAGAKGRTLTIGKRVFRLSSAPGVAARIAIGACDWLFSAAALYALMPPGTRLSFPKFATMFATSQLIAMPSGSPGGLGVFEAIMLTFRSSDIAPEHMAAALLGYRLISFAAPVAIALVGLVVIEGRELHRGRTRRRLLSLPPVGRAAHWLWRRAAGRPRRNASRVWWNKSRLFARAAMTAPANLRALAGRGPVLVLAPHPDGETLGCGGLIAACARNRAPVHIAFLTDGGQSHSGARHRPPRFAARSRNEAISAMARLGVDPGALTFLSVRDGRLLFSPRVRRETTLALQRLTQRLGIRRVFATWMCDPHPENVAIAKIARDIGRRAPRVRVFYWPIWSRLLPSTGAPHDRRWRAPRFDDHSHPAPAPAAYRTQAAAGVRKARGEMSMPMSYRQAILTFR
jgi:uncharacterized membrane protein YbhN (UPF0104 family)/LmbE family N-acetylglucosaminyl deacetylase